MNLLHALLFFATFGFYNATTISPSELGDERCREEEIRDNNSTLPQNDTESNRRCRKFFGTPQDIIVEQVDFVTLRLRYILNQSSSELKDLVALQAEEFKTNKVYKVGWEAAKKIFEDEKKQEIFKQYDNSSIIKNAPTEYHIALITYTMGYPNVYQDFNAQTRALCSGLDIMEGYSYKSFFKLLHLATQTLGPEIRRLVNLNETAKKNDTLYRGVGLSFDLNLGQLLSFQHFISTSKDSGIAGFFSGLTDSTVFEIQDKDVHLGIYLGAYSLFPGEEEVLLSPLQIFQVVNQTNIDISKKYYVLKTLPIINEPVCDSKAVVQVYKDYAEKLKMVVTVIGIILGITLLAVCVFAIFIVVRRKHFSSRTISELQLF